MSAYKVGEKASDDPNSGHRSLLRRIGSIASLQMLDSFHRRRSNNTTSSSQLDDEGLNTSTSASRFSSFSAGTRLPKHGSTASSHAWEGRHDSMISIAPPPVFQPQRNSYISLSDERHSGVPRSRTFSNLPIPTRLRKISNKPLLGLNSHPRVPSTVRSKRDDGDGGSLLSTTSRTYMPDNTNKVDSSMRKTENEGLSGSKLRSRPYAGRHGWENFGEMEEPLLRESPINVQDTLIKAKIRTRNTSPLRNCTQIYNSSPTSYSAGKEEAKPPSQPAQRWKSQPLLTTLAHARSSYDEIKQNRLISARQAPTPPLTRGPMAFEGVACERVSSVVSISHDDQASRLPRRSSSKLSPVKQDPQRPSTSASRVPTVNASRDEVFTAETAAYWTGRFSALVDRYCNEDLACHLACELSSSWKPKTKADGMHSVEANLARMRRAIEHLHGLCATEDARESFMTWQVQLGVTMKSPELSRPVQSSHGACTSSKKSFYFDKENDPIIAGLFGQSSGSFSAGKKKGFIDRLLGRTRRKSLTFT